jgi:hypothetical protein
VVTFFENALQRMKIRMVGGDKRQMDLVLDRVGGEVQ